MSRAASMKKNPNITNYIPTLCWGCQKAVGGCSWSGWFEPVPGWQAVQTVIKSTGLSYGDEDSYLVLTCPEFIPD